ncbi:uncharacterized protein MONBRDRAFT_31232 [Monosiga brevicollis MX1]|uniref:Isocitrate dehydrogenase [NADP] n=1 Tax=Monosiga brevicollis TaxID=81824 RepID=A9USI1_MONBE|nr:uncharacterized protein MONBRDRAFT_31232 [Monosiga brevicollis MX1]EDQ92104.1 predicted protein [Monosiga brevicollis MX1]|eukprot:XP_001743390.1 hypothetical protein [Monosiga brevicollis MX1]
MSMLVRAVRGTSQPTLLASRSMMSAASRSNPDAYDEHGNRRVTVAYGDGIGPEIMEATLRVLKAAGAKIAPEIVEIGEKVYERGVSSGIDKDGWESLKRTNLFLKAPITTPLGGGVKSLNVTVRKTLGLYANVRPVKSYAPFVPSLHDNIDMVIVRENEEDCYAGIEHRHTSEVTQCIKLITVPGTARVCKYAFDYALTHGRKRVSCITKQNIMKITDGLFHRVFKRTADQYPTLESEHRIVDIATAQVASKPHLFDVIVTLNLYGDIISDVAAEVAGSVGLCGSANVGDRAAMFEAIHGSAPDIAGMDIANPSGLINGAIMMLGHIGQRDVAVTIKNALLKTIEDGIHTADIYREGKNSKQKVGCQAFADAVIERLGQLPVILPAEEIDLDSDSVDVPTFELPERPVFTPPSKSLVGCDIFVDWEGTGRDPNILAQHLQACEGDHLKLEMISNRGVKVWPDGNPNTYKVNHWRCRFTSNSRDHLPSNTHICELMRRMDNSRLDVIKTENLYDYNGEAGYSRGQGHCDGGLSPSVCLLTLSLLEDRAMYPSLMFAAVRTAAMRVTGSVRFASAKAAAPKKDIVRDTFADKLKEYGKKHAKSLDDRVAQVLAERMGVAKKA